MSRQIIHIGVHKTATTYLQEQVFPNLESFTFLSRPFTQHNFAFNKMQYGDDTIYDSAELKNVINQINYRNLLISDESFSGKPVRFSHLNRSIIANRLKEALPHAEIILFIRGQQSIIKSQYNMWIKAFKTSRSEISEFIWRPDLDYSYDEYILKKSPAMSTLYFNTNNDYLHLDSFKYSELISLYKSLFSKVHVFTFEELTQNRAKTLASIESILGEEFIDKINKGVVKENESLNQRDLRFKLMQNRLSAVSSNKKLLKILYFFRNFKMDESLEDNDEVIKIITDDYYKSDNQQIIQKFPEIGIQNYPDDYLI